MGTSVEHLIALVTKLDDQASRKFVEMASTVEQTAKRIASAQGTVDKAMGSSASATDRLAASAKHAEASVEQLEQQAQKSSQGISTSSALIAGATGGAVAEIVGRAVEKIGEMVNSIGELAEQATRLKYFSQSMGMTTDEMQKFGYIAERFEVPLMSIARGTQALSKNMLNHADSFKAIGIEVRTAEGELRSVTAVMSDLAGVFSNSNDETAKLTLATKLFGEAGRDMMPILNSGAEAIRKVGEEAETTGRKIDTEAVESLVRFDEMMKGIRDRWQGFTIKLRVAIVDVFEGPSDKPTADMLDAVKWQQAKAEAAAKLFPGRFTWDARTKLATGFASDLTAGEQGKVAAEASRLLAQRMQEEKDAAAAASKAIQEAAERTNAAAAAAKKFETQLEGLNERLSSRDLTGAQIDGLAQAFNRGQESARSLLERLNTADAVMRVIDRARFLTALVGEYGSAWQGADILTRAHTDHLRTTEEKMRAVRVEMDKLLNGTKELDAALKGIGILKPMPKVGLTPSGMVPVTPGATPPAPGLVPGKAWEWLAGQGKDGAADAMIASMQRITASVDKSVDAWTEKFVRFRGFFGDVMRILVDEAVKAFTRMALMKLFNFVLGGIGGGGGSAIGDIKAGLGGAAGGLGSITNFGTVAAPGAEALAASSVRSGSASAVARGTTIIHVNALDLGTVEDRLRSPFGSLRLALESAQDSGR